MTTGRINQVCLMLLNYMQTHVTMVPYGSAAKVQLFITHSSSALRLLKHHQVRGTYNLTPASSTSAQSK